MPFTSPYLSFIPPPEEVDKIVRRAYDYLERKEPVPASPTAVPPLSGSEIAQAVHSGLIGALIPPDAQGRLNYIMTQIKSLTYKDTEKLLELCRLLREERLNEKLFEILEAHLADTQDGPNIERIKRCLKLIFNDNNAQKIVDDLYMIVRTSSNGAINILNPQNRSGVVNYVPQVNIPEEGSGNPIVIALSRSTFVHVSRRGTTLIIKSIESHTHANEITREVSLKTPGLVVIGRIVRLIQPLGLDIGELTLCDWGITDRTVSSAAFGIYISKSGKVYLFDFHSKNGVSIISGV